MPETAIKFGSYEAAKRALANLEGHGDPRKINSWSKFTAGGLAGMMAQYVLHTGTPPLGFGSPSAEHPEREEFC